MAIKFPKMFFRKILLGIVLIALAALGALFIKENLDTKDPSGALPNIFVSYNGAPIPDAYIFRAAYEWNFLTTIERSPKLSLDDIPIVAYDVMPQIPVKVSFSKTPRSLKVSRSGSRYSDDFTEIITQAPGEFITPSIPGFYIYKIEAEWAWRGSILYYIAVQTKAL